VVASRQQLADHALDFPAGRLVFFQHHGDVGAGDDLLSGGDHRVRG
jgi:hypothetical protein